MISTQIPKDDGSSIPNVNEFLWHQLHFQATSQERSLAIFYMVVCLAYFGLALVLFAMTSRGDVDDYYLPFHYSEFFGALVFNSAEAMMIYVTMVSSDTLFLAPGDSSTRSTTTTKNKKHQEDNKSNKRGGQQGLVAATTNPRDDASGTTSSDSEDAASGGDGLLEKIPILHWSQSATLALISINVVASAIAAVLFSMSPETFEVHSHWIEYSVQITVTLVDTLFITRQSQVLAGAGRFQSTSVNKHVLMLFAYALLLMAIFKMLLYGEVIKTEMGGERSSHFLEFLGEMFNSAWAFIFTLELYRALTEKQQDLSRKMRCILEHNGGNDNKNEEQDEENPLIHDHARE